MVDMRDNRDILEKISVSLAGDGDGRGGLGAWLTLVLASETSKEPDMTI